MRRSLTILFFLLLGAIRAWSQTPIINSVTPISTYPTNKILINGSGFSSTPAQLQVWFDQVSGSIVASSDFSIEVNVPPQARLANVQVTNLTSGLSAKADLKFVPAYSGTDFDPAKLATPLVFGATNEIFDVCSCDLDGDGKPDLAATKGISGTATDLMIQRNTSTPGSLSFIGSVLPTTSTMVNLACGDLNGDGKPELVVSRGGTTRNEVFIFRNTSTVGTISFAALTKVTIDPTHIAFRIVIRDLNLDGKPEIVVTDGSLQPTGLVYVFVNQSSAGTLNINPTPIKVSITGSTITYGLEVQDLDGDKMPEIIVNQFNNNNIFIVKNSSTPSQVSFSTIQTVAATGTLIQMVMADFNEDGKQDIVASSSFDNKALLLLNTSSGSTISFGAASPMGTGNGPFGIDASDIDGDGDVDVVIGDLAQSGTETELTVLRSNGNNSSLVFTTLNINVGKKTRNVRVGDLDGDGKPDIAFTTGTSNSLDILRNTNCFVPQILNQPPLTICGGQIIRLSSVPGIGVGLTYEWKESGNSLGPPGANAFFDINTSGAYTVTATTEAGACVVTSGILNVTAGSGSVPTGNPPTTVSSNSPVCTGNMLQLNTPVVAGVSYEWTGPAGFTSALQNPTVAAVTRANAGIYSLQLSNGTCKTTPVTTQVDIADLGAFAISSSVPSGMICQGGSTTLSVNSTATTYQWIKDGVDIGGQTTATFLVTTAGAYNCRVTNSLACATVTNVIDVKVVTPPVAGFTVKANACINETLTFTNTSTTDPQGTAVYAWNFGDATNSSLQSPTHAYATANTFNPSLTVSYSGIPGCSNGTSKGVAVQAAVLPVLTANPTSSCPGETVTLSAAGTFNLITWSSNATGATTTVTDPGTYSATTTDVNGCMATTPITVVAKPVPNLTISASNTAIAAGETVTLSATGADVYAWTPPESLSDPALPNPIATPLVTTTYTVVGSLNGGCSAQLTIEITVGSGLTIKVPNVFTPNGDGVNDLWVITGVNQYPECTLSLFDKDGKRILEQKGYTNNWDGTYQGRSVPEGTYYYVFGCPDNASVNGTVLVAR